MSGDHSDAEISRRVRTLETLLEERGLVDGRVLDEALDAYLKRATPANGKKLVARAWLDEGFRTRLLADGNAAIAELGMSMGGGLQDQRLRVVANDEKTHNVIVCTLCSCYPIALLGPSPSWYKSEAYRSRVVRDPRGVLAEFGTDLDPGVEVTVWDSSAETRYLVVPRRPESTAGFSEEQLVDVVTRNGLIGTALV
ncbi:nitrile hydratase subunit alpha [Fodinicola acaciae]|uniref:nitrile hydratase subunit alpha n=1 Tax=Fodinicola acaciae TaxID=2681555 RepID=UPI0013D3C24E|nr:nitrile hydratase subunit alpha [Fodinicola acaciae]